MKKLNFVTTIQARMTSTRLPGKTLKKFKSSNSKYNNLTSLEILINRIKNSKFVTDIIIATSTNKKDDKIESFCNDKQISCYRGNEFDVLGRLVEALQNQKHKHVIQLTADNPFLDPEIINYIVETYIKEYPKFDFVTNNGLMKPGYREIPFGMDVSVFSAQKLIDCASLTEEGVFREHPTLYFYTNNNDAFSTLNVPTPECWKRKEKSIRLTFDTDKDFQFLQAIYSHFTQKDNKFSLEDILNFLDKNEKLIKINSKINQKIPITKKT